MAGCGAGKVTGESPFDGSHETSESPVVLFRHFLNLSAAYWRSDERWKVRALIAGLVMLTVAQVIVPILINRWNAALFNALEQKSMKAFLAQIWVLVLILIANMVVTATHLRVKRGFQIHWRRWLTRKLLDEWMGTGRQYQLTQMPGEYDNPDGRIAEDIRITTETAIDLAHSFFYCVLLLLSFTQILWSLSGVVRWTLAGHVLDIPGHMVWIAIIYASAGTLLAMVLGKPLVHATNRRQRVEANFRFGLVHGRENAEEIAMLHGEADERRRLGQLFRGVEGGWDAQTSAHTRIMLFTAGYSVLSTAFPILITAPRYIAGTITLGALMQTAQAFQQMAAALSWPIDNMAKAAEWRASMERVLSLHVALQHLREKTPSEDGNRILVHPNGKPALVFKDLYVADPNGETVIDCFNAEIWAGERVLISGDPAAALKLFKVVAGLWPWGHGNVDLPSDAVFFFLPERPYLPHAALRAVLSYPSSPESFDNEALMTALAKVGLEHLSGRLDETTSWQDALTTAEEQRLSFARLLLQRPNWIFIEEGTDALDPTEEREIMGLMEAELPKATIFTVGFRASLDAYHQRKLMLERREDGVVEVREDRNINGLRR
ncbi:MAG: ABC transporter ATP-binding protein/permease [Thermodesulfobacteriota bacterium]